MLKDKPCYCILDCYFKPLDDDFAYYKISDKELAKLIAKVRKIEFERDVANNKFKRYKIVYDEKIKRLRHEKHMYKVELKRCVRKLTRIYQNVYKCSFLGYVSGYTNKTAKECVDAFKHM